MAIPSGHIRPIVPADDREVRFIIGKETMQPLAMANRLAYMHPVTLSIWFALSCILIQYMNWWPNPAEFGWISYLNPLRAFASVAVPILALMDWVNRPYFEKQIHDVLRKPDMIDICAHYSRSPSSALWILEFNNGIIGLIAIDGDGDSGALVRHFYVDEQYLGSDIQGDLLLHAVKHAFQSNPALQQIKAPDSPLAPHLRKSMRSVGFQLDQHTETVGIFRWKLGMRVMDRAQWEKKNAQKEN